MSLCKTSFDNDYTPYQSTVNQLTTMMRAATDGHEHKNKSMANTAPATERKQVAGARPCPTRTLGACSITWDKSWGQGDQRGGLGDSVKVAVRVRPMSEREAAAGMKV